MRNGKYIAGSGNSGNSHDAKPLTRFAVAVSVVFNAGNYVVIDCECAQDSSAAAGSTDSGRFVNPNQRPN